MRIKIWIRQIRWNRRICLIRRVRWIRQVRVRIHQIRVLKIVMLKVRRFKEIKSFVSKENFLKVMT